MFVTFGLRDVMLEPFAPFVPSQFGIKLVSEPWERRAHFRLRRRVFAGEQHLFEDDDRDAEDDVATPIVAVDYLIGMANAVVGTVRIAERVPGLWYGSRLAIEPAYRSVYGLGSGLVYRAACTANARGAHTFLANVQRQNVPFFRRLAWDALEEFDLLGVPHTLMRADLAHYPPSDDGSVSLLWSRRAS